MIDRALTKAITSMAIWQLFSYAIPLVTFPYLTRVLGIQAYGDFSLAFAVITYLTLITDWGFNLTSSGAVAGSRGDRQLISSIFWNTIVAKMLLATACFGVLVILILVVPSFRRIYPELLASYLSVVANVVTVNWCLQGLERLGLFALASIIGRLMTIPATFLLVRGPSDAYLANLVQSCGALVGGLMSIFLLRRLAQVDRSRVDVRSVLAHLSNAWHLFVSILSANLYTSSNVVLLGLISGSEAVGVYAAADRLRSAAQSVVDPISNAVYPRSTKLIQEDPEAGFRLALRILLIQGGITFVISSCLFFGASVIIGLLAGPAFQSSVAVLRWLAVIPFFVGISNVLGIQLMVPLGMKKIFSTILVSAALLNIALVSVLVWSNGAVGAAIGSVVAELYVMIALGFALKRAGVPIQYSARSA